MYIGTCITYKMATEFSSTSETTDADLSRTAVSVGTDTQNKDGGESGDTSKSGPGKVNQCCVFMAACNCP